MDNLPFDEPILLRSHYASALHNIHGMYLARCSTDTSGAGSVTSNALFASVMLHRLDNQCVTIQSYRNKRFLAVDDSVDCRFTATPLALLADKHKFYVEAIAIAASVNHLFFVSATTSKVLQCGPTHRVRCENTNRGEWEAWQIIELRNHDVGLDPRNDKKNEEQEQQRRAWIHRQIGMKKTAQEIREYAELLYPLTYMSMATAAFKGA